MQSLPGFAQLQLAIKACGIRCLHPVVHEPVSFSLPGLVPRSCSWGASRSRPWRWDAPVLPTITCPASVADSLHPLSGSRSSGQAGVGVGGFPLPVPRQASQSCCWHMATAPVSVRKWLSLVFHYTLLFFMFRAHHLFSISTFLINALVPPCWTLKQYQSSNLPFIWFIECPFFDQMLSLTFLERHHSTTFLTRPFCLKGIL